jgi:GTPase SAR1 family protein
MNVFIQARKNGKKNKISFLKNELFSICLAICGERFVGKSTLMKMLAGEEFSNNYEASKNNSTSVIKLENDGFEFVVLFSIFA